MHVILSHFLQFFFSLLPPPPLFGLFFSTLKITFITVARCWRERTESLCAVFEWCPNRDTAPDIPDACGVLRLGEAVEGAAGIVCGLGSDIHSAGI